MSTAASRSSGVESPEECRSRKVRSRAEIRSAGSGRHSQSQRRHYRLWQHDSSYLVSRMSGNVVAPAERKTCYPGSLQEEGQRRLIARHPRPPAPRLQYRPQRPVQASRVSEKASHSFDRADAENNAALVNDEGANRTEGNHRFRRTGQQIGLPCLGPSVFRHSPSGKKTSLIGVLLWPAADCRQTSLRPHDPTAPTSRPEKPNTTSHARRMSSSCWSVSGIPPPI